MPWTMKVKSRESRMFMRHRLMSRVTATPPARTREQHGYARAAGEGKVFGAGAEQPAGCCSWVSLHLRHSPASGLPKGNPAVAVLHPIAIKDLEALLLPGSGDAEDRDRLRGIPVELQARLDHPRATMSTRVLETIDIIT